MKPELIFRFIRPFDKAILVHLIDKQDDVYIVNLTLKEPVSSSIIEYRLTHSDYELLLEKKDIFQIYDFFLFRADL